MNDLNKSYNSILNIRNINYEPAIKKIINDEIADLKKTQMIYQDFVNI